jgi:hypothetical protein
LPDAVLRRNTAAKADWRFQILLMASRYVLFAARFDICADYSESRPITVIGSTSLRKHWLAIYERRLIIATRPVG